ncbi:unnamed protein product [Calypogeia fissa]
MHGAQVRQTDVNYGAVKLVHSAFVQATGHSGQAKQMDGKLLGHSGTATLYDSNPGRLAVNNIKLPSVPFPVHSAGPARHGR